MKDSVNCVFGLELLRSQARVFQFKPVRKKRIPIRVENKHLLGNRIDNLPKLVLALLRGYPQLLFALPESVLGALPFRNIPDNAQENLPAGRFHWAEHDVNWKLGAIFASAVKL